jgi:hypothetical protein
MEFEQAILLGDDVNLKEEAGDICWGLAILGDITGRGVDLFDAIELGVNDKGKGHAIDLGALMEAITHIKGVIVYPRALDVAHFDCVRVFARSVGRAIQWHGLELADVQESNIRKLRVRFPDKFTKENANTRDLESERKAIG